MLKHSKHNPFLSSKDLWGTPTTAELVEVEKLLVMPKVITINIKLNCEPFYNFTIKPPT
jgi:hypothetical protein